MYAESNMHTHNIPFKPNNFYTKTISSQYLQEYCSKYQGLFMYLFLLLQDRCRWRAGRLASDKWAWRESCSRTEQNFLGYFREENAIISPRKFSSLIEKLEKYYYLTILYCLYSLHAFLRRSPLGIRYPIPTPL
jgi:hypothetical protein